MTTEELEAAGFAPLTDPYEMPREEEELERCKKQLENGKAGPIPYRMRWIDHEFVEIWAKPRVKLVAREKDRINGNKESNE